MVKLFTNEEEINRAIQAAVNQANKVKNSRLCIKPHTINKKTHFIGGWYINKNICTDLIKYFENSPNQTQGVLSLESGKVGVNKKEKLSTDVCIRVGNQDKEILNYYKELTKVVEEYKKKYKYCNIQQHEWGMFEDWNLQKYKPKEGYFMKHFEKTGGVTINRHLAFMTYLNDVRNGGETEFYYQKLKIKPEAGLTLIWGTDWTTTHRGLTSRTETKYIATGWYSYGFKK
jgi:hypothetical protein